MGFLKKKQKNNDDIIISNRTKNISSDSDSTLLEVLLKEKVSIHHSCEGNASCGTCRVLIEEGLELLPERTELELEFIEGRGFPKNERLACQLPAVKGIKIKILS